MPTYPFPLGGVFKGSRSGVQPKNTSHDMNNVRPRYDGRYAGGQRPALDKWSDIQVGAAEQPVVAMCTISTVA